MCDITYIRTHSGWLYLAAVLSLHSRKIVGWEMASVQRNPAADLVVYSDRGTQYAKAQHQGLLKKYALVGSMSRKGDCWQSDEMSAVMERNFLNLEIERVWQKDCANHSEVMTDVSEFIVGLCNCARLHFKLGNFSPNAFDSNLATKPPIDCPNLLAHQRHTFQRCTLKTIQA